MEIKDSIPQQYIHLSYPPRFKNPPIPQQTGELASCSIDAIQLKTRPPSKPSLNSLSLDLDSGSSPYFKTFFVNGITTSKSDAQAAVKSLESSYGSIKLFYNPTEGFVKDVRETLKNHQGTSTQIAEAYAEELYLSLKAPDFPPNGKICLIAHSQGAALTKDALVQIAQRLKSEGLANWQVEQIMSLFSLKTIGGFINPSDVPPGVNVEIFKTEQDGIPQLNNALHRLENAVHHSQSPGSPELLLATIYVAKTLMTVATENALQFCTYLTKDLSRKTENGISFSTVLPGLADSIETAGLATIGDHTLLQTKPEALTLRKGYLDTQLNALDIQVLNVKYKDPLPML